MSALWHDIRFGFRMLVKNFGFTTVSVLSIALGIGASTAIFSLVNAIFLRSLPVPKPHELRTILWAGDDVKFNGISGGWGMCEGREVADAFSYPAFAHLREQCAAQADIFSFKETDEIVVRARHNTLNARGLLVTDNFFSALQARPLIGRLFMPGDNPEDDAQGMVITYPMWERQFGLDPGALGQSVTADGRSYTIIGILPQGFPNVRAGSDFLFYVSMEVTNHFRPDSSMSDPGRWWLPLLARKKAGVTETQLQAALDLAFAQVSADWMTNPKTYLGDGSRGARDYFQDEYKKPLFWLFCAVGILLLVVCANLAGLLLARGAARQHEYSIRASVGAGQWRLIRQTLTESLVLCSIGAGFGLLFALWGRDMLSQLLTGKPDGLHYNDSLDLRVLLFTIGVTVMTAVLSGFLPAFRAAYASPLSGLKTHNVLGSKRLRNGKMLVTAQIALSLLLLTGAGLYVRTLVNIVQIDPGFSIDNILWAEVSPGKAGYERAEIEDYLNRTRTALASNPGIHSTALSRLPLLSGWCNNGLDFTIPGLPPADEQSPRVYNLTVGESFFATLGIPVRAGRALTLSDTAAAPKTVVVNETFVRHYLPGVYPIGQILRITDKWGETKGRVTDWRIEGVCADAKYNMIKMEVPPTVYYPYRQKEGIFDKRSAFLVMRTSLPASQVANSVRQTLTAVDPDVPIHQIITQKQLRDRNVSQEWMYAVLCSVLALFAVLLVCIGLYGLMAYNAAQRTSEIGVRMALGATGRSIVRLFLYEALRMALFGVLLGGLGALGVMRFIQSQLYGVASNDLLTYAAAFLSVFAVSTLAAWIPARRAAKADPMTALRCE